MILITIEVEPYDFSQLCRMMCEYNYHRYLVSV